MAKLVGKLSTGLQERFANEPESDHPYVRLLNIAKSELCPLALQISALEILLKYRMPTLSAQLVQVDDIRNAKPIGRLEIIAALCAASPEERELILGSKKPLQLGGPDDAQV